MSKLEKYFSKILDGIQANCPRTKSKTKIEESYKLLTIKQQELKDHKKDPSVYKVLEESLQKDVSILMI